jgi:phosphatidylinositol 3-kinase
LGSDGPAREPEVRKYAIERLARAENADLEMFLLQLVQALKYENIQKNENNVQTQMALLQESMQTIDMSQVGVLLQKTNSLVSSVTLKTPYLVQPSEQLEQSICEEKEGLADFLLDASVRDQTICSFLYWFIKVEMEYRFVNTFLYFRNFFSLMKIILCFRDNRNRKK